VRTYEKSRRKAVKEQNGGSIPGERLPRRGFPAPHIEPSADRKQVLAYENLPVSQSITDFPFLVPCSSSLLFKFGMCSTAKLFIGARIAPSWALGNPRVLTDETRIIVFPLIRSVRLKAAHRSSDGRHVAEVCPQSTKPGPSGRAHSIGRNRSDDEVDRQAARGSASVGR